MALVVNDRVQETTTTTGQVALVLSGAVSQFQSFSAGIGDGNSTYYVVADQSGVNWEEGIGTYTASGSTLSRTAGNVINGSAGVGVLVNFGAGTKNVFSTYPAKGAVLAAPYAYPTVKPSLNLDFVNSKQLDQRVSFSRASTATYYDGKTTAVAEQNLLTYSQDFSNAAWIKNNSTITPDNAIAPDGTTTADTIFETAITATHFAQQNLSSTSTNCAISVYVKPNGRDWCLVVSGAGYSGYWFNVTTGVVGTAAPGTGTTSNPFIVSVGNGWYRVGYTTTSAAGIQIFTATADNTASFTGDITKGLYLWGAQLEQRSAATAYTPTTTTPITNYIPQLMTAPMNAPKLDYDPITGKPLGLLIEESRTNLITYSSDFSNAVWSKITSIIIPASNIAPDGTQTSQSLIESATNSRHFVYQLKAITATSTYSASVYIKAGARRYATLGLKNNVSSLLYAVNIDLLTGLVTSTTGTGTTNYISSVGNGWYRCSISLTSIVGDSSFYCSVGISNSSIPTWSEECAFYQGDGYSGVYIWGAQLETGSFATSYIPTTSATATRSADNASMVGANFSSWYNHSQGSIYCEVNDFQRVPSGYSGTIYELYNSSTPNGYAATVYPTGISVEIACPLNGSYTGRNFYPTFSGNFLKIGQSYSYASNYGVVNGGTSVSATTSGISSTTLTSLSIGNARIAGYTLTGHIRKLVYYPQALSTANLQALTS